MVLSHDVFDSLKLAVPLRVQLGAILSWTMRVLHERYVYSLVYSDNNLALVQGSG